MGRYEMSERAEFFIEGNEFLAEPYHYVEIGLDYIFLLNGVSETETDYGTMVHIENINGLHHAIGLHIVEKEEPMSGAEFRFLRKQMGLTQAELAKDLGISDQTIANYEKSNPLGPADAFMRASYLLSVVPAETRVEAVKPVLQPAPRKRKKLPEFPRRRLVNGWAESELQAA
jgi:transcriptional regulator with XRE-family HTH domain